MNRAQRRHPERFDLPARLYKNQEECFKETGLYPVSSDMKADGLKAGDKFTVATIPNRTFIYVDDLELYLITGKIYGST
jgi:hypothetical protein